MATGTAGIAFAAGSGTAFSIWALRSRVSRLGSALSSDRSIRTQRWYAARAAPASPRT